MHLRWDGHIADFYTNEVKDIMRAEGGRNNEVMNHLWGMCDHWEQVHSEMQTPQLFTKIEGVCTEHD